MTANAADRSQVQHAARKEREALEREVAMWRAVLATAEGREVLMTIVRVSGIYPYLEPLSPRGDEQQRLIGMQRLGQFVFNTIEKTNPEAWILMQREDTQRRKKDAVERDAVQTASLSKREANS